MSGVLIGLLLVQAAFGVTRIGAHVLDWWARPGDPLSQRDTMTDVSKLGDTWRLFRARVDAIDKREDWTSIYDGLWLVSSDLDLDLDELIEVARSSIVDRHERIDECESAEEFLVRATQLVADGIIIGVLYERARSKRSPLE